MTPQPMNLSPEPEGIPLGGSGEFIPYGPFNPWLLIREPFDEHGDLPTGNYWESPHSTHPQPTLAFHSLLLIAGSD